jgi:Sec-independent protein translocase protein TatA
VLVKAIFSPAGLILIAFVLFVIFFPRRPPDIAKPLRKKMRAFPEDSEKSGEGSEPEDGDSKEVTPRE